MVFNYPNLHIEGIKLGSCNVQNNEKSTRRVTRSIKHITHTHTHTAMLEPMGAVTQQQILTHYSQQDFHTTNCQPDISCTIFLHPVPG